MLMAGVLLDSTVIINSDRRSIFSGVANRRVAKVRRRRDTPGGKLKTFAIAPDPAVTKNNADCRGRDVVG